MIAIYFLLLTFLPPDLQPYKDAIYQLGSPKFAVREAASRKLWDIKNEELLPLLREAAKDNDLEVRSRAEHILYHHYERILLPYGENWPWIDVLSKDTENREEIILKYRPNMDYTYDYNETDFSEYREATSKYIIDLLDDGKDIEYCKKVLDKMWKNEKQWTANGTQHRWSYSEIPVFEN